MSNVAREKKIDMFSKQKSFTLIELLVVIAVIGLLSSIVLVSLKGAREKARASKAIQEIKQVQTALELYYDQYERYPNPGEYGEDSAWCDWDISTQDLNGNGIPFVDFLVNEGLISAVSSSGGNIFYNYANNSCGCTFQPVKYALIVYNLETSIPGVTDNDPCDNSNIWNPACGAEAGPLRYCILGY